MGKVAIILTFGLGLIGLFLIGGAAYVVVRAWLKGTK